jgi:hypothetical protein
MDVRDDFGGDVQRHVESISRVRRVRPRALS